MNSALVGGPRENAFTYLSYLLRHRTHVLAPWIVACSLDLFLWGVYFTLLVQFFFPSKPNDCHHQQHARRTGTGKRPTTMHASSPERWRRLMPDTPRIVFLVCLVAVFTTLKSAAALYILFLNSIVLSDSPLKLAVASFHNWVMVTSPLMTHFVDLAVQSYYISLLYNLFKADAGLRFGPILRWTLFIGISLCFMLATATGILAVYEVLSLRFEHPERYVTIQLASSFVGDALISGGTVYCLMKSSVPHSRHRSTFTRFARTIALSASLPALLALFNLCIVATDIYFNRWHIVFDFSLSKVFSISFMWTIRIRRKMVNQQRKKEWEGGEEGGIGRNGVGYGGAGGGSGCCVSCCCNCGHSAMGGSKRIDYTERNRDGERDSRHHHSPADDDEYFANPSMFAATMPPQRTTTIQSIEMGQYAVNSNKVDWNGKGGGELPTVIAVPIASMPKSKESFYARSGSSEQSGSSPVQRTTFLNLK